MPRERSFIVVIGASAGGLNAMSEIVSQLPPDINAAILVVLHLSKAAVADVLLTRLQKNSALTCKIAENAEPLRKGFVYIAPPDSHLLVKEDQVLIGHGPKENRFRPSIDVLFRSAAAAYSERAIGVILTGMLNDGTVGAAAIKGSGGHCIVQDPNEAEYPDMPLAVMEAIEVDQVLPLREIGAAILQTINEYELKGTVAPKEVIAESKLSEKAATALEPLTMLGEKTLFACPDCGGGLWEIRNGRLTHYRCHIGHSYTENDLLIKQSEATEQTLWAALRMMEERKLFLQKIEKQEKQKGLERLSSHYRDQSADLQKHISNLKQLLFATDRD